MIPIFEPDIAETERSYLAECADSGWISSQGRFITEFEQAFAGRHGTAHGVATSSCTTALHLALSALDVGPGDEVLCPDLTFIAPANMIRLCGATPVLIDVEEVNWAIDPEIMARKITSQTKAVMVIHPFGHSADMDAIMSLAKNHGLVVIEDVAEAPDATYKDKKLGTFGAVSCFSFFANKIITTGEGGMVLTDDPDIDEKLRVYRDHGMDRNQRYVHTVAGFNYRMTNMQAAIGLAQVERMDEIQRLRHGQAERYRQRFADSAKARWRQKEDYCSPVHWMATITLRHEDLRNPLLEHLKTEGVDARQMIFPVHMAEPYRELHDEEDFPVSRRTSLRSLHLPSSTNLTFQQINKICDLTLDWLETNDI